MNLIVISEPELIVGKGTRNNALNEILTYYLEHNQSVTYFSSSDQLQEFNVDGVEYFSLSNYSKQKRIVFKEFFSIRKRFKEILAKYKDAHVQFRLPSLYSMQIYLIVKNLIPKKQLSFYIAGDWQESLKFNYPEKLYLSKILPVLQNKIIQNHLCVFTGKTLLNKNVKRVERGFAFYSTTHANKDVPETITDKSEKLGICFIGRIEKLKNFNFFIELAKSEKTSRKYSFHLLGDGPETTHVKDTLIKSGITNLTLHGHVNDRVKFDEIISNSKYFVLPSYTEGTSKTLPEMMCRSTIPIAFNGVGSNNDILQHNNGFLSDVDDLDAVINFINEVDMDNEKYFQILQAGNKYAKENAIEKQLKTMFEFLYAKVQG
jgi:glycosyltransferase involved in cell wall biosynthesis